MVDVSVPSLTLGHALIPVCALVLCLALYIVRHYAMPGTSCFIQFLTCLSFAFGFFGLALMPIDLSLTTSVDRYVWAVVGCNWCVMRKE